MSGQDKPTESSLDPVEREQRLAAIVASTVQLLEACATAVDRRPAVVAHALFLLAEHAERRRQVLKSQANRQIAE